NLLLEIDPDARHRHWLVRQSVRLWTACLKWLSPHLEHYPSTIASKSAQVTSSIRRRWPGGTWSCRNCSVTMLVLLASLCRMAACKRWVSIRCLWSAYCTYSLTNCKYPWWPPRLFQRSTDVRIFRKHARISLSVLSPSKGTWIRVLASCRPSRNSHIV